MLQLKNERELQMKIKELIAELQKLDSEQEIYISDELELNEPVIQTMDFKDDTYHLLTYYV